MSIPRLIKVIQLSQDLKSIYAIDHLPVTITTGFEIEEHRTRWKILDVLAKTKYSVLGLYIRRTTIDVPF